MPALGWPVDEGKRKQIERDVGQPVPFYDGSTKDHCSVCGLEIWLGPRVAATVKDGARPICIFCAVGIGRVIGLHTVSLDNPDRGGL